MTDGSGAKGGREIASEARVDFIGGVSAPGLSWPQLGRIVSAATATRSGVRFESAIRCRRPGPRSSEGGSKRCSGFFVLRRLDLPPEIRWRCTRCGGAGVVVNWNGSLSDLTPWFRELVEESGKSPARYLSVTTAEFEAAAESHSLDRRSQLVVFRGRRRKRGRIFITASLAELVHLQEEIVADANCEPALPRRRRLYRVFDRIARAVGDSPSFPPMPPIPRAGLAQGEQSRLLRRLEARARELVAAEDLDLEEGKLSAIDYDELKQRLSLEQLPELAGLSFAQLGRLLDEQALGQDASDPSRSVLRLNDKIAPEEIAKTPALGQIQELLASVREGRDASRTTLGPLEEGYARIEREGLVERRGPGFVLTASGEHLLEPSSSGELFAKLFRARLGAASGPVMEGAVFSLFALARQSREWRGVEDLLEDLVLPLTGLSERRRRLRAIRERLLPLLEDFALLERRERRGTIQLRKSELFDRFLSFRFDGASSEP